MIEPVWNPGEADFVAVARTIESAIPRDDPIEGFLDRPAALGAWGIVAAGFKPHQDPESLVRRRPGRFARHGLAWIAKIVDGPAGVLAEGLSLERTW